MEPENIGLCGIGVIDELRFDRFAQRERESLIRHSRHLTQQREIERWTDDRCDTQRLTGALAEASEAVLQCVPHRRWEDHVADSALVVPAAVAVDKALGLHQRLEDFFREERIAFAALVDRLDKVLGNAPWQRQRRADHFARLVDVQLAERHRVGQSPASERCK